MSPAARWLVAALLLGAASAFCGCRTRASDAQKGPVSASWAPANAWTDGRGEVQCPVCGTEVQSVESTCGHESFGGREYYFCCVECQHSFHQQPDQFADGRSLKAKSGDGDCPPPSGDPSSGVCK